MQTKSTLIKVPIQDTLMRDDTEFTYPHHWLDRSMSFFEVEEWREVGYHWSIICRNPVKFVLMYACFAN